MSVICFDDQYLKDIGTSILKSEAGRWTITYSDVFAAEHRSPYGFGRGLSEEPLSEEKKDSYIATQLMYLIGIANKVAFSVTYGEHLELNTLTSLGGGKNTFLDSAELWRELKHIRYNLISNGGNYFLAQRWDQLLTDITEGLAANVIRATLARCEMNQERSGDEAE